MKRVLIAVALIGVLLTSSSPAAAKPAAAPLPADGVLLVQSARWVNANYDARCRAGQSWVAMDYNNGVGRGRYDMVVRIRAGHTSEFADWEEFLDAPDVFTSQALYGPGSPGREDYIYGVSEAPRYGTLGVELFAPGTADRLLLRWWNITMQCGSDYAYWFRDA